MCRSRRHHPAAQPEVSRWILFRPTWCLHHSVQRYKRPCDDFSHSVLIQPATEDPDREIVTAPFFCTRTKLHLQLTTINGISGSGWPCCDRMPAILKPDDYDRGSEWSRYLALDKKSKQSVDRDAEDEGSGDAEGSTYAG
jgi:hypothetical protein